MMDSIATVPEMDLTPNEIESLLDWTLDKMT